MTSPRHRITALAALALALAPAHAARAQDDERSDAAYSQQLQDESDRALLVHALQAEEEDEEILPPSRRARGLTLDPYAWIYPTTNVRNSDGDVFTSHTGFKVLLREPLNEKLSLRAWMDLEYSKYDFGGDDPFAGTGSEHFENLWQFGGGGTLSYKTSEQWSLFGGGFIGFAAEENADLGDSIIGGGTFGASYNPNEKFRISFGLGIRSRLEDDPLVLPLISLYWQFHEEIRLEAIPLPQGSMFGVVATPFEQWEFGAHLGFQYRQWRLNDGGPTIGHDAVFRDTVAFLAASAAWKPTSNFTMRLIVGATVYRELSLLDDGGSKIDEPETDPGAFIGLRLNWLF